METAATTPKSEGYLFIFLDQLFPDADVLDLVAAVLCESVKTQSTVLIALVFHEFFGKRKNGANMIWNQVL